MLEVNGSQITLVQLRYTVYSLLDRINREARELMFHWWPDVNLHGIKDNLTSYRPGYSFLEESENDLQMSFKHLHRRAFFSSRRETSTARRWTQASAGVSTET